MSNYRTRENANVEAVVDHGGHVLGIEYAHDAVHEDHFVTAAEYDDDLDIVGPNSYLIVPLAGHELHCVFNIQASSPVKIELYEGTYASANGTALTHMRHNRKSLVADDERETTFKGPTVVDDGTLILTTYSGGSGTNPNNQIGGQTRNGEEIVLNPAEVYMVKITATADNTKLSFANEYYEVPV